MPRSRKRSGLWVAVTEGDDQAVAESITPHPTGGGRIVGQSGR